MQIALLSLNWPQSLLTGLKQPQRQQGQKHLEQNLHG